MTRMQLIKPLFSRPWMKDSARRLWQTALTEKKLLNMASGW